jgi:xylan 1,4-beta-xylosidase
VPNPVTSTGHADLVVGPDGNWWSVFLGCRPFDGRFYATGRETFLLPVTWTADGWPRILPHGERVPYVAPSPMGAGVDEAGAPLTGNFTWRDDFTGDTLSPFWLMLRSPKERWWNLGSPTRHLRLVPRSDGLAGDGNPSFLGRRLQHSHFDASTALEPPTSDGVSAGLAAFQSETHNYYLGVRRSKGALQVFLEQSDGKGAHDLASVGIPVVGRIELRLTGDESHLDFSYAAEPGKWNILAHDVDGTVLTTQTAGGFVGAVVGVLARIDPLDSP